MRWPWNRPDTPPSDDHLLVVIRIQWGLARIAVHASKGAPPMWLHGVVLDAVANARDTDRTLPDTHACAIDAPIRMSPGGRFDDAWRPSAFALDDGSLLRPTFRAMASVSAHRRHPVAIRPPIEVVDDFRWADGRYELIEGSSLWRETHEPPERTW